MNRHGTRRSILALGAARRRRAGGAVTPVSPDAISGLSVWLRSDRGLYKGTENTLPGPVLNFTAVENFTGAYANGSTVEYFLYGSKVVGGTPIYTDSYAAFAVNPTADNSGMDLAWDSLAGATSYRLIRIVDFGSPTYQDVATNALTDDGTTGWLAYAGGAPSPTAVSSNYLPALVGDAIAKWADQSGNSHDALQPMDTQKFVLGTSSGLLALSADGVDDYMATAPFASQAVGTLFLLYKLNALGTNLYLLHNNVNAQYNVVQTNGTTGFIETYAGGSECQSADAGNTSLAYITATFAGNGSSILRLNKALAVTGDCGSNAVTDLAIFGNSTGGYVNGYCHQVIRYNRVLTAVEIAGVEAWLTQWAETLPPTGAVAKWLSGEQLFTDAGVTRAADGDTLYRWGDQSGNAYHLDMATAGQRPLVRAGQSGIAGLTAIQSNALLSRLKTAAITLPAQCTLALVGRYAAGSAGAYPMNLSWGDPANAGGALNYNIRGDAATRKPAAEQNSGIVIYPTTAGTANYFYVVAVFNATTVFLWINGSKAFQAAGAARGTYVGASQALALFNGATAGYPFNGYIGEGWVWDTAITDQQVADTFTYFNNKFGTPVAF